MNCDTLKYKCGQLYPSACVPYTGKDLTLLADPTTLGCDANINDVIFQIDAAVHTLIVGDILTGLNPRCLSFNPAIITPAGLHQVEIDKICGLDASLTTLINTVNNLNIGTELIVIDLQCMTPAAAPCLTPPNSYSLLSVLNMLVSEICALKIAVGI